MPQMSMVARATEIGTDISYLGWNDSTKELEEKTAPEGVIALDSTTLVSLKDGYATKLGTAGNTTWYITDGTETTITDYTSISGTVNLILRDSTTLTLNGNGQLSGDGIQMDNGSTLNIYTQSDGANKGVLNVSGYNGVCVERDHFSMSDPSADLNLYGGALSFTGTTDYGITGATTSIYGGMVDVASRLEGFDAGIEGNVISYGGTLTASGGAWKNNVYPGIEGTITAGEGFTVSVQTKDTEGGTWADATLTDNKTNAQFVKVTATKSGGGSTPETNGVSYWDWNSSQKILVEKKDSEACTTYTTITDSTTEWSDGWYVVSENVTISSRITVTGTAHLILCDSKTLTAEKGITTTGKALNIYAQSKGDNMGKLIATANTDCCAGIGGIEGGNGGTVTINGGSVEATGGKYAAGIGGGGTNTHEATVGAGGAVTINGGNVKAGYGMGAAGIGGGYNGADLVPGDGADVTINGGTVQAEGNNWAIGGGFKSQNNGTLTLNNGVTMQMKQYDTDDGWLPYDGQTRGAVMQTVSSASSGGTPTGNTTSGGGGGAPASSGETYTIPVENENTTSGGGGGAPTSSGETYTIPVENENTVSVGAEIKDGTATVNEITDEQIAQATQPASGSEGAQEQSDTLTIDLSGAKQKVDIVEIPEKTVEKLADAAADSDNNVDKVAVKLSQGEIEFDANAMNTISNEATGSVKVEIAEKKTTDLNASQQASLEGKQTEMVFGVNVSSNGKEIHQFNGNAKVSKNHVATKDKNFYHIEYLPDNGKAQRLVSEHTGNQGIYKERHASDYAIVYDENDQNENIKPIVGVSAKSLTYNGKKQNVKNLKVEVLSVDDVEVPASAYEISGKTSGKNVGTYNISIKAKGDSGFRDGASGTWKINKGKTSFKLKDAKVAAKKLEKKGKTVKVKVNKLTAGSSKPTFKIKKVTKGQKKNVEINKKTGAVTIKKGCGKCEITVVATSKANKNRKKGKATAKVVVK